MSRLRLGQPSFTERVIDQGTDLLITLFGVWLVDQGIDAVQLGWWNTLLIGLGVEAIITPIMFKLRN